VQPCAQVGALGESSEGRPGPGERILHKVLGILSVPGHLDGGAEQLRSVRKCLALEPLAQVSTHGAGGHWRHPLDIQAVTASYQESARSND